MHSGHQHHRPDTRVSRLVIAAAVLGVFFVIELTTALLIDSIALLADAGHMLTDLVALSMGLTAVLLARHGRPSSARTYGWHRAEVFAAVANAVLLLGVAVFIFVEAIRRLGDAPEVPGVPMIVVALAGLIANLVVVALLRSHSEDSLAVKGAYLEVLADTVSGRGPGRRRCPFRKRWCSFLRSFRWVLLSCVFRLWVVSQRRVVGVELRGVVAEGVLRLAAQAPEGCRTGTGQAERCSDHGRLRGR